MYIFVIEIVRGGGYRFFGFLRFVIMVFFVLVYFLIYLWIFMLMIVLFLNDDICIGYMYLVFICLENINLVNFMYRYI